MINTGQDEYARLLKDFRAELCAAETRHAGSRRRRRHTAGGVLALAGIAGAGVVLAGVGGGGHLDLVAQAKAALAPDGQIVHLVTTSHIELRGGTQSELVGPEAEANTPRVAERWSTATPLRWRVASTVPIVTVRGTATGPVQLSYGGGTEELYNQSLNALNIRTGVAENSPRASLSDGPLGGEPVSEIRTMLETGQLHDAGAGNVDGRSVRRLMGDQLQADGHSWPVEYDVDPETFAPVRFTLEESGTNIPGNTGTPILVVDVNTYEEIPLNDSSASLLSIHPLGNPTVNRHQAGEPTAQSARRATH